MIHATRYRDVVEVVGLERDGRFSQALSVLRTALAKHGMPVPEPVHIAWLFPWTQETGGADGSPGRHEVLTGVLRGYLTRRAVVELAPMIEQHALDLLSDHVREQIERGNGTGVIDLAGFAHTLAFRSMSSLAGFPQAPADEEFMLAQLAEFANRPDVMQSFEPEDPSLREYFQRIVSERGADAAGLMGDIVAAHEAGVITLDERDALIWGCWSAGSDTTATLISLLVGLVDEAGLHDTMLANLDEHGRGWRQTAINEALRFTPFGYAQMISVGDVELASGFPIPDGAQVRLHWAAANRDPEIFGADADRFNPNRQANGPNLAFGHGRHYCLGAPLARAEADIAVVALYRNLPDLTIVDWHREAKVVDLVTTNRAEYDLPAAARKLGVA